MRITSFLQTLIAIGIIAPVTLFGQGSLTPPGAPVPTMKTLSQIEPRTAITSAPYTISSPGSYYLTTNFTVYGANGITISSGNVTLDLNGFTLTGSVYVNTGIYVGGNYTNITIRNGSVSGWGGIGVDTYTGGYPRQVLIENIKASSCVSAGIETEADSIVRNCFVTLCGSGIVCHGGQVSDCICRLNNNDGIDAYSCIIRNCRAELNKNYGLYLSQCSVFDSSADNNVSTGILADGGNDEVRHCRASANGGYGGILANTGVTGGTIADCVSGNNTGAGVETLSSALLITGNECSLNTGGGIIIQAHNCYVENNHVLTSTGVDGIVVVNSTYTNNVVSRNVVQGNPGGLNYYNPGNNDFGPIGSASSATSPWANISH